jgi:hypothetical protein
VNQFWLDVKATIRELLHPEPLEQPDTTTPDQIAKWVESHRHPKEEV